MDSAATEHDPVLDEVEAVAGYRSVSVTAIVAFVLALFSPVALLSPSLIFIPLAASFIAAIALVKIARSDGSMVGRPLAAVALLLGLLFTTADVSTRMFYTWRLAGQAQPWAEVFIDLLRNGDMEAAYELTLVPSQRTPLEDDVRLVYAEGEPSATALEEFAASEVVPVLTQLGDEDRVKYIEAGTTRKVGKAQQIVLVYEIDYADPEQTDTLFRILMEKRASVQGLPGGWRVLDKSFAPPG